MTVAAVIFNAWMEPCSAALDSTQQAGVFVQSLVDTTPILPAGTKS